jgi:four helix bundle protein
MEKKRYDLQGRTARFGMAVIEFLKQVPATPVVSPLIGQLVRSATSMGANLCEADCAETKKDFIHKMGICNKEAKETTYWLQIIRLIAPEHDAQARVLLQEAHELQLIFVAIIRTSKANEAKKTMSNVGH